MENIKQFFKQTIAMLMIAIMLICAAPLDGFVGLDFENPFKLLAAAEENSIKSISVSSVELIEYTNGWTEEGCYWDDETGTEVPYSYFHYDIPYSKMNITVELSNGETVTGNGDEIGAYFGNYPGIGYDQSCLDPWGLGEHKAEINLMDVTAEFTVTIVENPIESIVVEDISIMEYTDGYFCEEYWDDDLQQWMETHYFRYYTHPRAITINYKDGTNAVYSEMEVFSEETGIPYSYEDDQAHDNPWDVGTHTVTLKVGALVCEYNIEITEHIIKSISVEPVEIIENASGWMEDGYYWDEETGTDVPYSYFRYDVPYSKMNFTVELSSGEIITGDGDEIGEYFESYPTLYYDQSPLNPWGPGEYTATVSVMGITADLNISVVETPVESITVEEMSFIEGTNGWMVKDAYWDEEIEENIEVEYYYYLIEPQNITVTFKNGTVVTGDRNEIFEQLGYDVEIIDGQSPENPWGIGEHAFEIAFMGKTVEFYINIVETPIKNITIKPIEYRKGTNGWLNADEYGEYYQYSIGPLDLDMTVELEDRIITGNGEEISEALEYNVEIYHDQSYENRWDLGEHTVTVYLMGAKAEFTVTIVDSNVERIEIAPMQIIEGTNGWYDTFYVEDEEKPFTWFRYNVLPESATVYYKDGTIAVLNNADMEGVVTTYFEQNFENQWTVGNTYDVRFEYEGFSTTYGITICESPVKSITVEPIEYIEGTNGWIESGTYWDDETQTEIPYEYFRYSLYVGNLEFTVELDDGRVLKGDFWTVFNQLGCDDFVLEEQSYENPWGLGENTATLTLMGKTAEIVVKIVESPIESIEVKPMKICKDQGGWTVTDEYEDEETGEVIDVEYYFYFLDNYSHNAVVTFKDGSKKEYEIQELADLYNDYPSYKTNQSYENQWLDGEHTATLVFMGKSYEFSVVFCEHENKEVYEAVDADCKYEGYTAGVYCGECGCWLEGREWIAVIPHADKNGDGLCDMCSSSISLENYKEILSRFLWLTDLCYDKGTVAPDSLVFDYVQYSGDLKNYYDEENWSYTISYVDYMALVDKHFTNHSDMKDYLSRQGYFTDDSQETLSWGTGGFGDAVTMKLLSVYDNGNGVYTLQGVRIYYDYYDMSLLEQDGYCKYEYEYRNQFGNIVTRIYPARIRSAYELTVVETEKGIKIDGFEENDYYILDGTLYNILEDGSLVKYNTFDIDCGEGATVVTENGLLSEQFNTFENNDSMWYAHSTGYGFDIEVEEGYEVVSVTLKDANGEKTLSEMSFGGYSIIPDGNATLVIKTVNTATHTHSYSSAVTKPATCTETGVKTYTCSCEDKYTETIPATGHNSDTVIPAVESTCTKTGLTAGKKCSVCGTVTVAQKTVAKTAHNSNKTIPAVAATYTKTGKTVGKKCSVCGKVMVAQKTVEKLTLGKVTGLKAKTVKVAKSSSVTLVWSKTTGAQKYEVYQKSGKKWKKLTTTAKTSYTVKKLTAGKTYEFRVRAVRPDEDVEGTYATVEVKVVPVTPTLTLKAGKKRVTASWKSASSISGYEVQYSTSKTMKKAKTVKVKKSTTKTTVKKLTKGKKYYVRVRAYTTVNGKKIYSNWSTIKNVKVK